MDAEFMGEPVGEPARKQMVLFFVIDTSGSMEGTKIGTVNTAIKEVLPELKGIGGSDVEVKIACLTFSSGCEWMHPKPIPVEAFQWSTAVANGVTDFGAACSELARKMSRNEFLNAPSASVAPAIFLMSDGEPTDDYKKGIADLQHNKWFGYAIKVAVAIGNDANTGVLKEFTGNSETVVSVHTPEALKKWIRFLSVSMTTKSTQSKIQEGKPLSKDEEMGKTITDWDDAPTDTSVDDEGW
jgi:uncharacterized protein YegL